LATGIPVGLTAAEGRKFGLTVGTAFIVLAGMASWRERVMASLVFASLGALLVLAGLVLPARLGPVFRAWMGLAHVMSKLTTPVFLAVVYFVVLAPVGLLMRLFGRRPLERPAAAPSWWVTRAANDRQRVDMERQF
jgi:saxitoxin biosynthesis operon SxtJ-like protein